MTKEHSFVGSDYSDRDLYVSSRTQERALNSAIVRAEINESFEEYLEIFEAFYADNIEVSSETAEQPIRGKDRVRSLLTAFLVPRRRSRWFIDIHSTDRDSWRCWRRHAFRVDARLGRRVRQDVHGDLAGPPEMERVAGSVRASL
jgi:hypothetical protein